MIQYKRLTKKKLAKMYGVSFNTFTKWVRDIPEINIVKFTSLTPKQIKMIFDYLGEPDYFK